MRIETEPFRFFGSQTPSASADNSPWLKTDTSAAGAPTMLGVADGMELTLASTSEVENLCLSMGDVLNFDIDLLKRVDIWARTSASNAVGADVAFGVASARNDTIESIGEFALFKVIGAAAAAGVVSVSTDDGTNDTNVSDVGQTLAATMKRFVIDFASGVKTVSPGPSLGGKANVLFSMDNGDGNLRPVGQTTLFDMSNYSGGLQLFAQLQKTAIDSEATLTIGGFDVTYQIPN